MVMEGDAGRRRDAAEAETTSVVFPLPVCHVLFSQGKPSSWFCSCCFFCYFCIWFFNCAFCIYWYCYMCIGCRSSWNGNRVCTQSEQQARKQTEKQETKNAKQIQNMEGRKKNNNKKPSKKRMGLSSKEGGSAKTFTEIKYRYMVRNIYQDRWSHSAGQMKLQIG